MKHILTKIAILVMAVVGSIQASAAYDTIGEAKRLIIEFEGFSETVYRCSSGTLSIGYGFTDEKLVSKGFITRAEADKILDRYVREELAWVKKTFPLLSPKQQVAIVALSYNVGRTSLVWKRGKVHRVHTRAYINLVAGNWKAAAREIRGFRRCDGKISNGLIRRREAELKYLI